MRLHILSDLHLEFGPPRAVPTTDADVVMLAGDIDVGPKGLEWAVRHFPSQPVLYICGNHEFYRNSFPGLIAELKERAAHTQVHVLENESLALGGYTFLAATLWTDFALAGDPIGSMREAHALMNDYRIIRSSAANRPLRAEDTARVHAGSVAWLRYALRSCDPARTIVVTHHAPSARAEAPCHASSPLKPAFSSDLDRLISASRVPLWVYGHTHYNTEFTIGRTRVLTNQYGYPQEPCQGFNPGLVVEL